MNRLQPKLWYGNVCLIEPRNPTTLSTEYFNIDEAQNKNLKNLKIAFMEVLKEEMKNPLNKSMKT